MKVPNFVAKMFASSAVGVLAFGAIAACAATPNPGEGEGGAEALLQCPESSSWSDLAVEDFLREVAQSDAPSLQNVYNSADASEGARVLRDDKDTAICVELNDMFASSLAQKTPGRSTDSPQYSNDVVYYYVGSYVVAVLFDPPGPDRAQTAVQFRQNPAYTAVIFDSRMNVVFTLSNT
jgi:hypothetical protein